MGRPNRQAGDETITTQATAAQVVALHDPDRTCMLPNGANNNTLSEICKEAIFARILGNPLRKRRARVYRLRAFPFCGARVRATWVSSHRVRGEADARPVIERGQGPTKRSMSCACDEDSEQCLLLPHSCVFLAGIQGVHSPHPCPSRGSPGPPSCARGDDQPGCHCEACFSPRNLRLRSQDLPRRVASWINVTETGIAAS
jgi:hypothetical protein